MPDPRGVETGPSSQVDLRGLWFPKPHPSRTPLLAPPPPHGPCPAPSPAGMLRALVTQRDSQPDSLPPSRSPGDFCSKAGLPKFCFTCGCPKGTRRFFHPNPEPLFQGQTRAPHLANPETPGESPPHFRSLGRRRGGLGMEPRNAQGASREGRPHCPPQGTVLKICPFP